MFHRRKNFGLEQYMITVRLLALKAKCYGSEVDLSPQMSKCRTKVCSHSGVVSWAFRRTMAALLKQMGKLQCCAVLLSKIQLLGFLFKLTHPFVQTKTSWPAQCYISILYLYLLTSFSNFVQEHLNMFTIF